MDELKYFRRLHLILGTIEVSEVELARDELLKDKLLTDELSVSPCLVL